MFDKRKKCNSSLSKPRIAVLLGSTLISIGVAQAFEIESDNPDVAMRFDNTVRYNAAWRVADRNRGIVNNPAHDEAEYLYNKGDLVTDRLDLFSEFDFVYQKNMGFRVSGAAWYDERYGDKGKSNPLLPGTNYPGNQYTNYVKRFYEGPSAEFLDAFVWKNFQLGETDLGLKFGRHALLWGEATFPTASGNSVAVDMAPSDGQKQVMSPGATAKETTLPIEQLTGTWQFTDNMSLSGQYTFEWRPTRVPEGGTYLGAADALLFGPPLVNGAGNLVGVPPGNNIAIPRAAMKKGDDGDWGLALKWRPEWFDGSNLGFYYRDYAAKTPTWPANTFLAPGPNGIAVFPNDIKLWGASISGNVMGTAVGAEIVHRHNTPLNINQAAIVTAAQGFEGPRGDVWSGLVNTTTLFNQTDFWTSASLVFELTYQELDKVTQNPQMYKSRAYTLTPTNTPGQKAVCTADDIAKGCSTNSAWHLAMLLQPVWSQVWPSTDLTGTFVFQTGLKGNAPTTGISEGASVLNLGLQATYAVVNIFNVSYTNFWGKRKYFGNTSLSGPYQVLNGQQAIYDDRDFISFTYSRTF